MNPSLRSAVLPAFLFLALILGGSAQAIWGKFLLQLVAIAILAWAALTRDPLTLSRPGKALWLIVALAIALVLVQLVPLPPAIWTDLPGRRQIVEAFALIDFRLGWMPISLTPHKTLEAIASLLPPLAMLAACLRLKTFREGWFVVALLAGTLAGIMLGMLQVTSPDQSWYLYRYSAFGAATGFFANSNHMATLLLVSLPFLTALASNQWTRANNVRLRSLILALAGGGGAVILVGLILNGSFAVLLLGVPVALACVLLLPLDRWHDRRRLWLGAAILAVTVAGALTFKAEIPRLANNSVETRSIIWAKSGDALRDHWPAGSGVGSFVEIYQRDEQDSEIDNTYVNDAHNDYLQLLIETGLPGALILLALLWWWASRVIAIWRSDPSPFARAATIASAAILVHSVVDYPLRTSAIAVFMALCLAMMVRPRTTIRSATPNDIWPTRHVTVE